MQHDQSKQAEEWLHTQKLIAGLLARMYLVEQQKQAEQVPHSWTGHMINLSPSDQAVQVLASSTRRAQVTIWNDGPSDCVISSRFFEMTTILQQFNGAPGSAIDCVLLKNGGDPFVLNATGPVYAAPFAYGQGAQNTSLLRFVETKYTLSTVSTADHATHPAENEAHKWAGLSAQLPNAISSVV